MAEQLKRGELFRPELVNQVFNLVKGESALAKLSQQEPMSFNGKEFFTFNFDNEVDVVAESGKKTHGGITYDTVKMVPIKVEYGARVSDEYIYASEEQRLNILQDFSTGFARKLAKALDLMSIHGINPRTGNDATDTIGENAFVKAVKSKAKAGKDAFETVENAIDLLVEGEEEATGLAVSPKFSRELSKVKFNNLPAFPELSWGGKPVSLNGLDYQVNSTVSNKGKLDGLVGDFKNYFKWGFAKDIEFQQILYGDPDNSGRDLSGYNEVYLRAEAYIGWGILRPEAFALIEPATGGDEEDPLE